MATDREIVVRQNRDLDELNRLGMKSTLLVAGNLRQAAFRWAKGGPPPDINKILHEALEVKLRDAMVASYIYGARRGLLTRDQAGLSLGIFDEVIKFVNKRVQVDVFALQKKFGIRALAILDNVGVSLQKQLATTVADVISKGQSVREGVKTIDKALTNSGVGKQSKALVETVFRTQTQLAYGAGKWEADHDPDIEEILWGYKYVTVGDDRVRPTHEALDGTTLPKDDPFWQRFFPPNGWNCRCAAVSIFTPRKVQKPPKFLQDNTPVEPDDGFAFNPGTILNKP